MNSDAILRELNRLVNSRNLTGQQRNIVTHTIQHVRLQDEEINKIRRDITGWEDPDDDPPAAA